MTTPRKTLIRTRRHDRLFLHRIAGHQAACSENSGAACRPTVSPSADVFEYLVIVSSLVRPAAITFVHDFIRRAHGQPYEPAASVARIHFG